MPRAKKEVDHDEEDAPAKRRPAKKDPNKPKGAKSAYMLFSMAEGQKIRQAQPNLSPPEVMKEVGKRWGVIAPAAKAKFEKLAAADKERYAGEMEDYTPPSDDEEDEKKKKKGKKDPNAPKRAASAYLIFSQAEGKKVRAANPEMSAPDVMREVGARWAKLNPAGRKPFEEKAALDKERYEEEMTAYRGNDED